MLVVLDSIYQDGLSIMLTYILTEINYELFTLTFPSVIKSPIEHYHSAPSHNTSFNVVNNNLKLFRILFLYPHLRILGSTSSLADCLYTL